VIGMAPKPGTSRQTNQPAKTAPEASLPLDASALSIVAGLEGQDLNGLRRQIQRTLRSDKHHGAAMPFDRRAPQTRDGVGLKVGALLVREWNGKLERVMILEDGFAWNGRTFGSLSQIAKAMTGTNWNGHRFFGLRHGRNGRGRPAATAGQGAASGEAP
jgi:hypothetical protein